MLEEATDPRLFLLSKSPDLEFRSLYSDLIEPEELEPQPGKSVPGTFLLPNCVGLELGTLLPKSVELVPKCLLFSKCVKCFILELDTPFFGLIRDAAPESENPTAELLRLSTCLETKPGAPFSCLMRPGIPFAVLLGLPKYFDRGDPAELVLLEEFLPSRLVLAELVRGACFGSGRLVFVGDFRLQFWKRSCTVALCFGLSKLPLVFVTLTGEPLMLTKALWLPMDLLGSAVVVVVMEGDLRSAGGVRAGSGRGSGECAGLRMDVDGRVLPPRTIPLPLNGMTFLMS